MKKATGDARSSARRIVALLGFPILLAAVFAPVVIFRHDLWGLFSSVHKVEEWVRTSGPWAPLAFIGIQVFHVIIFIIPGEAVQIAGGYLFGIWPGALYAAIGVLIGSPIDFYLARLFGVPFVNALFTPQKVEKLRAPLGSPGSKAALFLLFLIPGIPKDAVCYVSGLSPLRFRFFILASMAGRSSRDHRQFLHRKRGRGPEVAARGRCFCWSDAPVRGRILPQKTNTAVAP